MPEDNMPNRTSEDKPERMADYTKQNAKKYAK